MKTNKNLNLSESLKRYNLLSEYNFYIPRKDEEGEMYKGEEDTLDEQDVTDVEPAPETTPEVTPEPTSELPPMETTPELPTTDVMDTTTTTDSMTQPSDGGEVEVDVTDIVKDTKETKDAVNTGNQKVDELLNKLNDLEEKLSSMNDLVSKIDELETQFEKRNPTPEEKLEMRSFDSFPYNLKLTDYWSEKEGAYDVLNKNKQSQSPTEKEYVLTQGEVENDYNEGEVSDSFYPEG